MVVVKLLHNFKMGEDRDKVILFYLERIMEQAEAGYLGLARVNYHRYKKDIHAMLNPNHVKRMEEIANQGNQWTREKELMLWERMNNAWEFSEYKTVHDCGHEILSHYHHLDKHNLPDYLYDLAELLATNNLYYIEPDEIAINTFINARIEFLVEKRKSPQHTNKELKGNPGFYLTDSLGRKYRCFIKQVEDVSNGDIIRVKITNLPGLAIANGHGNEPIIYFEPRVTPGELIEIELSSLSHTQNSFTFRHYSYDGFLWFKRRGVNRKAFNKSTLNPKDRIIAKVLYTTEEEKRSDTGNITRLGIIKAIPLDRAEVKSPPAMHPKNGVAKALN